MTFDLKRVRYAKDMEDSEQCKDCKKRYDDQQRIRCGNIIFFRDVYYEIFCPNKKEIELEKEKLKF